MLKPKNIHEIDGLEPLLSLLETEDKFLSHFFSNVKFFKPEVVEKQAMELKDKIVKNDFIPVRYSMKCKKLFYSINAENTSGTSKKGFKNKKDAQLFDQELFHQGTGIKVCIDKDGNYYVRKEIFNVIDYKVSQGAISDIKNYMICHVWGETSNPLFFTSLWNLTLIPNYLSFITDKPDENSEIVKKIKNVLKAICIELYNPKRLLKMKCEEFDSNDIFNIDKVEEITSIAKKLINEGSINFIVKKPTVKLEDVIIQKNNIIPEESVDNKVFILSLLSKLADTEDESLIEILTSKEECKNKFDIAFSILREYDSSADNSIFNDDKGSQRYYKKNTFFENNNNKYIICNHWFPKQRELFEFWVDENINLD